MKMHWIIVLALLVISTGCDQQAADRALKEAKAAEAEAKLALEANADSIAKTETSAKLDARKVLDDAIAAAKADDKALLVHFTADW